MSGRHKRERKEQPAAERPHAMLWVVSDVTFDGTYVVSLNYGEDVAWTLSPDAAVTYALTVLAWAQRAEYDGAIMKLFVKLGLSLEDAGQLLATEIRPDRPDVPAEPTLPLVFGIGVTAKGKGFIKLNAPDMPEATVDIADIRQHAYHVLETVTAADLDAGLVRVLRTSFNLEEHVARNVVMDLANYR